MKNLPKCFEIIKRGNKDESRKAARQVRKLLYGAMPEQSDWEDIRNIINTAPVEYSNLVKPFHQENFVVAVSVLYYLHDREKQPDFLFPWLFHLIQHPSGNIRHAAVRMFENEIGPLTYHIRLPKEKHDPQKTEQADMILYNLYANLNDVAGDLWKPAYKKYKYVASLPTGAYKSIQMVLVMLAEDCGEEYMARLVDSYRNGHVLEDRKSIIEKVTKGDVLMQTALTMAQARLKQMREEMEKEMAPAIQQLYPNFDFQSVVEKVYKGGIKPTQLISSVIDLDKQEINQINSLLDLVSTIWNIYPHQELDGYSPYEIAAMYEIVENNRLGKG